MKIDSIEIFRVAIPMIETFRCACGDEDAVGTVLVRMSSDGLYGWGESSPGQYPGYCGEWDGGQFMVTREFLAPRLIGSDIQSGEELQERLSVYKGNNFAKAALDLAWWDLYAKSRGLPLWKALGGRGDTAVVGTGSGVLDSIETLLERIRRVIDDGYTRMKLKYMPGWELDMLSAVRRAFPDITLHIDCNSAYTLDDLPVLRQLDQYNLAMVEQPLMNDDLADHAKLHREISTPICLDESVTSPDKARKAIEMGACQYINIKPGRVGGLTNAVAIHNIAREANIPCWVGGMLESAVGVAHNTAMATLPNIRYPSDIPVSKSHFHEDLARPETVLSAPSQMTAQPGPGIGVEPVPDRLEKMTIERAILRA
ncbi:MAG: o-succinylbenzoate synthase [Planctomycetota bacterium]|nr:o-succinylbenzoate synthase [Planctomycetota bacterium]